MRFAKLFISSLIVAVIAGCAHPIVMSPDISKIERDGNTQTIPRNVGYYIMGDREAEVITAGGGGDKVRYKPYKDIETGFYKMLSNVFRNVTAIKSDGDESVAKNDISLIISLDVSTNSSSPSLLTWPPTQFGVNLNCDIKDVDGRNITKLLAVGEGHAEFDEFKSDHSLSAERASLDALNKMQRSLLNSPEIKVSSGTETHQNQSSKQGKAVAVVTKSPGNLTSQNGSAADKLRDLNALYKDGVISKKDFESKKQEILNSM